MPTAAFTGASLLGENSTMVDFSPPNPRCEGENSTMVEFRLSESGIR
jgi:hypothetical protein